MILFLIKKTFFDFWDNLSTIIMLNLGFLLILIGAGYMLWLFSLIGTSFLTNFPAILVLLLSYFFFIVPSVVFFIYMGTVSKIVKNIADFKKPELFDFLIYLKQTYKPSSIFAVIFTSYLFCYFIACNFYLNSKFIFGGFNIGIIIFILLFFLTISIITASQYFFPLQTYIDLYAKKNLRKMFLLFYDNIRFSVILLMLNILIGILSVLTFYVFFGFTVNLLLCMVAFKLRLYKYDYYDKHPNLKKRKIPWKELLSDDMDKLGKRTLKTMIFPWKK
jgi:hypothetical protein